MIVFAFVAGICSIPVMGFTQVKDVRKKIPEGKWALENISAFENNVQKIPFSTDSLSCCMIPVEISVQNDSISFVGKDKVKYNTVFKGKYLCFPICAEWEIVDNKLYLQWIQDMESQELRMLTIVLTYKLK